MNYPWLNFGGDFGGIGAWSQRGVDGERARHEQRFAEMQRLGARVVRWWIFPDLRGDGIRFDASGAVAGLGESVERDLSAALDLAELHDVQLIFCLFSFDAMHATRVESGVRIPGLRAHLLDPARRAALMDRMIRPLVRAASRHPHASRIHEWEIINEPEWAVRGPAVTGRAAFTPSPGIETITHAEMLRFLAEAVHAIRAETVVPSSIGVARPRWAHAWDGAGIDRIQVHVYDTPAVLAPVPATPVPATPAPATPNPATAPPAGPAQLDAEFQLENPRFLVGEIPLSGVSGHSLASLAARWEGAGLRGVMAWRYDGASAADLASFADYAQRRCDPRGPRKQ